MFRSALCGRNNNWAVEKGKKALTDDRKIGENSKEKASASAARPDPRIEAFVRMLARKAAERDFAKAVSIHGKTHNDYKKKE